MSAGFTDTTFLNEITEEKELVEFKLQRKTVSSHHVGVLNSGKSVSDSDGGPSTGSLVESSLNDLLRVGVKSRCCLVQEQDLGVTEQCTGDGNTF